MRIEKTILHQLITNEDYTRKVIPFLKNDYFMEVGEHVLFNEIYKFFEKYNSLPTKEILSIQIAGNSDVTESENKEIQNYIKELDSERMNQEWLVEETEKFCKDKAVYNAILDSIKIIDGKDSKRTKDSIPSLLSDALSVSFDSNVGHDYFEQAEERWEYYHTDGGHRIPFGIEAFNKITKGGLKKKTLNVVLAPTGVGKSIFMCDYSAHAIHLGFNVLYITLEMEEKDISRRIDANLMNITMEDVESIDKKMFLGKIDHIKAKTNGKLIVKEFPAGAHAGHFRALIAELKQKKNFVADLLVIDYIGICGSQRIKTGAVNTNTYLKTISEELRNLGKEGECPVLSGHQVNREGQENSDVDITNSADSIGMTHTLDLFFALMAPEELVQKGQYLVKQLKNRYNDVNYYKKFVIGIDKSRMKFYDVEDKGSYISDAGHKNDPIVITGAKNTGGFDSFTF